MIFETHAHYDDQQFDSDRESLLNSMVENDIGIIVNIGSDRRSWTEITKLIQDYDFIYGTIGIHPSVKDELNQESLDLMEPLLSVDKILAVGEIGLDYYWDKDKESHDKQKWMFLAQMELARKHHLPIVIHSRDAASDTFDIIKNHGKDLRGIVHCYSYSVEQARGYVKLGYYIGVGGVVTFANAKKIKEVVADIPLESLVLETDSPYLAPVPFRGKRNSSLNLPYVARAISEIKGIEYEEVVNTTWENAKIFYGLS